MFVILSKFKRNCLKKGILNEENVHFVNLLKMLKVILTHSEIRNVEASQMILQIRREFC